jgi:hypothetical protein
MINSSRMRESSGRVGRVRIGRRQSTTHKIIERKRKSTREGRGQIKTNNKTIPISC